MAQSIGLVDTYPIDHLTPILRHHMEQVIDNLGPGTARAYLLGVTRVHVHTCSLDHPAALSAYRRAGFTAYKRAVERFPDPRLRGILPRETASQVPLLGTEAEASRPAS